MIVCVTTWGFVTYHKEITSLVIHIVNLDIFSIGCYQYLYTFDKLCARTPHTIYNYIFDSVLVVVSWSETVDVTFISFLG